jgi:transcriptional regulator with PAS, ATPase and Fis domain
MVYIHPIIREFINTSDALSSIVENHYNKNDYLEVVFFKVWQAKRMTKEIDPQIYFEIDQAILKGHADPRVYFLFISNMIIFTCTHRQLERAKAIHLIGTSILQDNFTPAEQAYFILSTAILRNNESNQADSFRYMKEAMSLVDRKHPRYISISGNVASLLSINGRLNELDQEDLDLINANNDSLHRIYSFAGLKLTNIIFTGNYQDGFRLLEEYKNQLNNDNDYLELLKTKDNVLKILSGDFDEKNYQENAFKIYANICHHLLMGDMKEALKNHQLLSETGSRENVPVQYIPYIPFERYVLLHIELNLKNKGKAKLILQDLKKYATFDYMIDFFLARLQLLELNREGAYKTFDRLINNVNRFGATNRLAFELQFAKEIKASDVLLLTNGLRDKNGEKVQINFEVELEVNNKIEKGLKLIVGKSAAILNVKELVKKFAEIKEPILITGETGTGKELVSRAIHDEGPYPNEPFLAINCGALTDSLLQSEFFGYEAGAFTGAQKERKGIFEAAGKGTVFLDEFGDISQKLQVSLLRVLEAKEIRMIGGTKTRQIECKIVIATNIDLHLAVEEKKFREDLYFRLTRFDIKIPSLRERIEDIPILIDHFLKDNDKFNLKNQKISKNLLDILIDYRWPGNIRELKNEIERLKILHSEKEILNIEDFDFSRLQNITLPKREIKTEKIEASPPKPKINDQNLVFDHNEILKMVQAGTKAEIRQKVIKELFQTYKKFTRSQIIKITSISPVTVTKELQNLCNKGFIKKITPTKSVKSYYFVLVE